MSGKMFKETSIEMKDYVKETPKGDSSSDGEGQGSQSCYGRIDPPKNIYSKMKEKEEFNIHKGYAGTGGNSSKDKKITKTKKIYHGGVLDMIPLPHFAKESMSDPTYDKDVAVVQTYGKELVEFITSSSTQPPIFCNTQEARAAKYITIMSDLIIRQGHSTLIMFSPFWKDSNLVAYDPDESTQTVFSGMKKLASISDYTKGYSAFKVVAAQIKIRQMGILQAADGYGTSVDAVIAPQTVDPFQVKDNLLNVNVPMKQKVALVDGRVGISACVIGSPDYPWIPTTPHVYSTSTTLSTPGNQEAGQDYYIPVGSNVVPITQNPTVKLSDGSLISLPSPTTLLLPIVHVTNGASISFQQPSGNSIFATITKPSVDVTYKIVATIGVELIPNQTLLYDVPMYVPPVTFDFIRLKYAVEHIIRQVHPITTAGFCGLSKVTMKVSGDTVKPKCSKLKLLNYKDETIATLFRGESFKPIVIPKKYGIYKKKSIPEKITAQDLKRIKRGKIKIVPKKSFLKKKFEIRDIPLDTDYTPMEVDEICNIFGDPKFIDGEGDRPGKENKPRGYCMIEDREFKAKKITKDVHTNVASITVPQKFKDAIKFTGQNVAQLNTGSHGVRIFRDYKATQNTVTYQYFPMVKENNEPLVVGIIGVTHQGAEKEYSKLALTLTNSEGKQAPTVFHYLKSDFETEEDITEFTNCLIQTVAYLNQELVHPFPDNVTVRFFCDAYPKMTSYMYALLAALLGTPSGGFYTGAFTYKPDSGKIQIYTMAKEIIDGKVKLATVSAPLFILAADLQDNMTTALSAGAAPMSYDNKALTTDNLTAAVLMSECPFRMRMVTQTPLHYIMGECSKYLGEMAAKPYNKYILAYKTKSDKILEDLVANKYEMTGRTMSKTDPSRFVSSMEKGGVILKVSELLEAYPEVANEKLVVPYKGYFYMYPSDLKAAAIIHQFSGRASKPNDSKDEKDAQFALYNINENEAKAAINHNYEEYKKGTRKKRGLFVLPPSDVVETVEDKATWNESYPQVRKYAKSIANIAQQFKKKMATFEPGSKYKIANSSHVGQMLKNMKILNGYKAPFYDQLENKLKALIQSMTKLSSNAFLTWIQLGGFPLASKINIRKIDLDEIDKFISDKGPVFEFLEEDDKSPIIEEGEEEGNVPKKKKKKVQSYEEYVKEESKEKKKKMKKPKKDEEEPPSESEEDVPGKKKDGEGLFEGYGVDSD